jgi:hypothetical protein
MLAGGVLQQRIDLDDIGAPIRELPHAGRPGTDAGEIEHGEAGQGVGAAICFSDSNLIPLTDK